MKHRRIAQHKPNATGRNDRRTGSNNATIILRRSFWLSPHVSALSGNARSLLIELTAMYSGPETNGRLFLSVRDAALRLGLSDVKAASSAFDELIAVGLLRVSSAAHFIVKSGGSSRARAFWLNWKDLNGSPISGEVLPALDFGQLSKKQKRRVETRSRAIRAYRKEKSTDVDSTTLSFIRASLTQESVEISTTLKLENGGLPPSTAVGYSATHIYYQGGLGAGASTRPASHRPRSLKEAMARRKRPGRRRLRKLPTIGGAR
jgi:hypothetical protein